MNTPDKLIACLRAALSENPARVQRVAYLDQFIWVKRRETLSPLRRLQKGNAAAAFESERRALHEWHRLQAPAPVILAEADDFIALADSGTPLSSLMSVADGNVMAFEAAGRALAALHGQHLSHGRPSLKDICWDGTRITFRDLERYAHRRNTPGGHAQDVVMFVFNGLVIGRGLSPQMQAAIDSYRANDTAGIWAVAQVWCRGKRWVDWITRPVQRRRPGKANEFKAIPLTLATFARP